MMPISLISAILLLAAVSLILTLVVRYFSMKRQYKLPNSAQGNPEHPTDSLVDINGFTQRLARMIQIPTVSWTNRSKRDPNIFSRFQEELIVLYPRVHATLKREVHGNFGLVYHWKGKNPDRQPVLFLAHYDVVPAEEKGTETWAEPPFSGKITEGILWGMGTLDIKSQLAFQMETAECLLSRGWQPDRDIYFAFGGDEEIAGTEGAREMAAVFKERGLSFEFIVDEGGIIAQDQLAFLKGQPAALIGLAEKGMVTFKITTSGESGHSSMPGREGTAIERLAQGVVQLTKTRFPSRLDPVMRNMLERFVPHVSPALGVVFANLWLFSPLILSIFSKNKTTDSLIRTTQAVTVFNSGEQENILPGEASCLVNHRIFPGETIDQLQNRHRQRLKDKTVTIADAGNWPANDPIQAGDTSGTGFQLIQKILADTHPGTIAVPFLVNGSTDSKYYRDLTDQILRFTPLVMTPADLATIHGVNERVSLENLENGLKFYLQLFSQL